jgi:hypothetical protein
MFLAQSAQTLGACHDHAARRSNVDASDRLIVTFELIFQHQLITRSLVEVNIIVASHSQGLPVSGEGMVGNGAMEEVVDLGARHDEDCAIGVALYYRFP